MLVKERSIPLIFTFIHPLKMSLFLSCSLPATIPFSPMFPPPPAAAAPDWFIQGRWWKGDLKAGEEEKVLCLLLSMVLCGCGKARDRQTASREMMNHTNPTHTRPLTTLNCKLNTHTHTRAVDRVLLQLENFLGI